MKQNSATGNTELSNLLNDGYLANGGEMGKLILNFDWARTSLGPRSKWSQNLVTSISILLQSPVPIVMLWGPDGIMIYNDAYSVFAGNRHPELLGSEVLRGWPEVAEFNAHVMENVMKGKTLSYKDQQLTLHRNDKPEEVWMDLNYSPINDNSGSAVGVFAIVVETTQVILSKQKEKRAEEALLSERSRLHDLFMEAPAMIAVLRGPTHVFELSNPLYSQLVGNRPLIGKTFRDAIPEIEGQGLYEILDDVYRSNKPFYAHELAVKLDRKGKSGIKTGYFNFVYQPSHAVDGSVDGILVHAVEVTDQVEARKKIEDIAEEQKHLIAMTNQRDELIKLNNAKDDFISLASHQLRTPATAVKQYISLLQSGFGGALNPEQEKYLQTAFDSNERQLNIINDLLKTAQIDSSHYVLHKHLQTIPALINDVIYDFQPPLQLKDQTVVFIGADDESQVLLDSTEMKLVFANLLENASKYSYPGSTISIQIRKHVKSLEIVFEDSGVGIEEEDTVRIFDKFTRINNELSDTVTGSGLGLYWVKRIVRLHKGTIKVQSTLNKGSKFIIRLPV